jgi:Na+-transporting methylmalonyl-CoA/oxaloacetate decarboxylase gamma subunit
MLTVMGFGFVALVLTILPPFVMARLKAERRAKGLRAAMPEAETSSIYLAFNGRSSREPAAKQAAMDSQIAEMARDGWTFLRATEASPFKTLRAFGGGLNLEFIRPLRV